MSLWTRDIAIELDAPIPTWFGVGGRADRMAHPADTDELCRCLQIDPDLRVLGEGANLLVDDAGVGGLVVRLDHARFRHVEFAERAGRVTVGAGADLSKLIHETIRRGLVGLETLIGVPASLGGAVRMNAGGSFGQTADYVRRVTAIDRDGSTVVLGCEDLGFGYRRSAIGQRIITSVELSLEPGDPEEARSRLKEIMSLKRASQPLREKTCGCVFKNPTLAEDIEGIGSRGERVGAGLLIDRAGGKGLVRGACRVSSVHANFVETGPGATASDIRRVIDAARDLVLARYGVALETEVVIWERGG